MWVGCGVLFRVAGGWVVVGGGGGCGGVVVINVMSQYTSEHSRRQNGTGGSS